jgi:predicted RNA-binding Zn-ribbon protein involved in translation (DUF1610 family)
LESGKEVRTKVPTCLACDKEILDLKEENKMGDEFVCDQCREEMLSSLEDAWKRHSAFLDSALN